MSQQHDNMVCEICYLENPNKHQDFCKDLSCSGRMVEVAPIKESIEMYAVCPPDSSYLDDFKLNESLANTPDKAWEMFCYPALRREGYESDGFKAKKVLVTIKVIE